MDSNVMYKPARQVRVCVWGVCTYTRVADNPTSRTPILYSGSFP